jgi:cytochrome c oxidase subunit IV
MTTDHAVDMTGDHAADIDRHVRVYITVFVALMALTVITVAVSYLDLSTPMAIAVALFIAIIKGSLVACYFMHLISEKRLIYAVLVITAIKFVALLALPAITHGNGYWIPEAPPSGAPTAPATSPH